ncbi:MAG: hypothetical protein WA634_18040 [Silvibacterium sp.]
MGAVEDWGIQSTTEGSTQYQPEGTAARDNKDIEENGEHETTICTAGVFLKTVLHWAVGSKEFTM